MLVILFDDLDHIGEPLSLRGTEKIPTDLGSIDMNAALSSVQIDTATVCFLGQEIGAVFFGFAPINHEAVLRKHRPIFPRLVFRLGKIDKKKFAAKTATVAIICHFDTISPDKNIYLLFLEEGH